MLRSARLSAPPAHRPSVAGLPAAGQGPRTTSSSPSADVASDHFVASKATLPSPIRQLDDALGNEGAPFSRSVLAAARALLDEPLAPATCAAVVRTALDARGRAFPEALACLHRVLTLDAAGPRALQRAFGPRALLVAAALDLDGCSRGDSERAGAARVLALALGVDDNDDPIAGAALARSVVRALAHNVTPMRVEALVWLGERMVEGQLSHAALAQELRQAASTLDEDEMRDALSTDARGGARVPLDVLTLPLVDVPGLGTILEAAHGDIPPASEQDVDGNRAVARFTRARPDLWAPLLIDTLVRGRGIGDDVVNDALARAADRATSCTDTQLGRADRTSQISRVRAGAIAAAALSTALLDVATGASGALATDALLHLAGNARIAKNGPERAPLLGALASLVGAAARAPSSAHAAVRARIDDVMKRAAPRKHEPPTAAAEAVTLKLRALAAALRDENPRASDRLQVLRGRLLPHRGGEGLLRVMEKLDAVFLRGAEANALSRLVAALEHGDLAQVRRDALVASRFSGIDEAALSRVIDGFSAGASFEGAALALDDAHRDACSSYTAHDVDGVLDWTQAVDDAPSCQQTSGAAHFNRGLLNRFEDGAVRLFALRDRGGVTRARATARLAVVDAGTSGARLALVVDKPYLAPNATPADQATQRMLLAALGKRRADALGVSTVLVREYTKVGARLARIALPPPRAPDYVDLGDHGHAFPRDRPVIEARVVVDDGTDAQPLLLGVHPTKPPKALEQVVDEVVEEVDDSDAWSDVDSEPARSPRARAGSIDAAQAGVGAMDLQLHRLTLRLNDRLEGLAAGLLNATHGED